MKHLIYYIDKGNDIYEPFYEYSIPSVAIDECYARQLCTYFIMRGTQYELTSNEMDGDYDVLMLKEIGRNFSGEDERNFRGKGIHIEFRSPSQATNYKLLARIACETHFDAIRYLLKDIVDVPRKGQMRRTSSEIDEDRGVYVIYVERLEEQQDV